jgi:FtsZ-interacting cell division protein ZipA
MEILFILGLLAIVGFGLWSMRETNKFVDEQNRQIRLQRACDRVDEIVKQKQMEFKFDK